MQRKAACGCGQLTVRCVGDPLRVAICHCLACQRQTGSPFSSAGFFRREDVQADGPEAIYTRSSEAEYDVTLHFCPTCGSGVWWESTRAPELVAVAVGAFADPSFPAPRREVWKDHRHPWVRPLAADER
jgi:hypothetical protein